jgi:endonuclease-3
MNKTLIKKIFLALKKETPAPATELLYNTPFELLIAIILSARATDVSVNKATKELFKHTNTPEKILALGERRLKDYVKTIGLYNTKASNIIKTCKILIEQYNFTIPDSREALQSLPGVGRKTANVVLNEVFGQPTIAVDTHVLRVANRLGLASGNSPLKVEQQLEHVLPQHFKLEAHKLLILHGRYVCLSRAPQCKKCVIMNMCEYGLSSLRA